VWWAKPSLDERLVATLDAGERERLAAYRRSDDRARFVTGATLVRSLYATELGVEPAAVRLDRRCPECGGPHGKVRLSPELSDVEVSVSHSGGWVVLAACRGYPVGVDVESVDRRIAHDDVAKVALSGTERRQLATVPAALRPAAFIVYWVRKEAALKAVGHGLRIPMTDVEVSAADEPPRITSWRGRPDLAARLRLHDLAGDDGCRAAVAVVDAPSLPVVAATVERSPQPPYWK